MNEKSMLVASAVLFGVGIVLGVALAFSNRQYNTVVFTIHKIASLGAAVITGILCYHFIKAAPVSAIFVAAMAAACIACILLLASGAFMSAGHGPYPLLKAIHIISTVLLTVCEIVIFIQVAGKIQ
jgi:hypothetical protein